VNPRSPAESVTLFEEIATLDRLLNEHRRAIGRDFPGYRNHAYRVANLCAAACSATPSQLETIAIAAAFHDLGIWTDGTFDYLEPSVRLARSYLAASGNERQAAEVVAMIRDHHKLTPPGANPTALVESFRRADWADLSMGAIAFGIQRPLARLLFTVWPSAGFHRRLVQLTLERWRRHPLSPLPMVRL
jgi:hypothetical protein